MDMYLRMIVGRQVESHMEDTLIINALKQGLYSQQPGLGLIAHCDRGGQYVSVDLQKVVKANQICQSKSRAGDSYYKTFAESFWSLF